MEEKKEKKKEDDAFSLIEVPTETAVVFKDNATEEILNDRQILLKILNKLSIIEKHL